MNFSATGRLLKPLPGWAVGAMTLEKLEFRSDNTPAQSHRLLPIRETSLRLATSDLLRWNSKSGKEKAQCKNVGMALSNTLWRQTDLHREIELWRKPQIGIWKCERRIVRRSDDQFKKGSLELRQLEIPGLGVVALWFHGVRSERFMPLPTASRELKPYKLYTQRALITALRQRALKKVEIKDARA